MLCAECRRQVTRGAGTCGACGAPLPGGGAALELQLVDGTRVALTGDLTIGRAPGNDLHLDDPSVSRRHARVIIGDGLAQLEDIGSSHGTWVDGARVIGQADLRDGTQIQIGNLILEVLRPRADTEAGRTMVVPIGASLFVPAIGAPEVETGVAQRSGLRPRLRSGHRVKRLDAAEGERRWVVEDLSSGGLVRLSDADGALLGLLDGETDLPELVAEADRQLGPEGPARLARLLADLGERGLLAGVDGRAAPVVASIPPTGWRRLIGPREIASRRLGPWFAALYRRGGWVLFTRPALAVLAVIAIAGLVAEAVLIGWRYGTPLVVASHLGLGGLIFLAGRGALVAVHETAHGLALASFGRSVTRAGLRLIVVFPYAFVDTSESWFEPKGNRIAVTLAGPISDFVLGGTFALLCLVLPEGTARDILFQAAFAAYVGALFNLNPFLDRDGYHVLVDVLGRPRIRERARTEFARRLSGQGVGDPDPALRTYAIAGVVWSVVAALFAMGISLRYVHVVEELAPSAVVWTVIITGWIALFIPVALTVGRPLLARRSG